MLCRIGTAQIQTRKHVLHHADCTVPTRQHELDHTDHTNHTDHTDREYICPETSTSPDHLQIMTCPTCETRVRYVGLACYSLVPYLVVLYLVRKRGVQAELFVYTRYISLYHFYTNHYVPYVVAGRCSLAWLLARCFSAAF